MIELARRSFVTGLVALVAAPAIVRAGSLMPVNVALQPWQQQLLKINRITREAVRLLQDTNQFIAELNKYQYEPNEQVQLDVLYGHTFMEGKQWTSEECRAMMERQVKLNEAWAAGDAKIGDALRIRLPNDYIVSDGPGLRSDGLLRYNKARRSIDVVPAIPDNLALAAVAVAVAPIVLAKPVTRRFWGK